MSQHTYEMIELVGSSHPGVDLPPLNVTTF
jgi:flavin-binding protein dodecin